MPGPSDVARFANPIAPYVRGAVSLVDQSDGLVLPVRFHADQWDHFDKIDRHERAIATAGVVIDFATDGTEVAIDCRVMRALNPQHQLYRVVMDEGIGGRHAYGAAEEGNVDGIDIVVDGRFIATVAPVDGTLRFAFENRDHDELEVRIYLPSIMAVAVGNLRTNGSLKPVPERGYMLTLGDSITQGFICGNPSAAFPAQIASTLGIDLLNQGVAGHTFDEDSLGAFSSWRDEDPYVIVVAYGTNDWSHRRSAESIEGEAVAYLDRLSWYFPKVPIYVLSPLWRSDEHEPKPCDRPLTWMHQMLGRVCSLHNNMTVVDGYHGVPKDPALFADGVLHPGPACMGLVADLLLESMCADSVDLMIAKRVAKRVAAGTSGRGASEFVSREEQIDRENAQRDDSPEEHPQFDRVVRTVWRLRQPDGCPWDREQTHQSIARDLIEEAYEVADAIAEGDVDHLCEELGDLLEHVLLQAQIAADAGEFTIDDVCRGLNEKLIRRHPHVFGEPAGADAAEGAEVGAAGDAAGDDAGAAGDAKTADEVLDIWDKVKRDERAETDAPGLLDSIPKSLPALLQAQKISKRAVKVGFEWDTVDDIWDKVAEERAEFEREEPGSEASVAEFGDMLFALVNVARRYGIDAEEALAVSNRKFRSRWEAMEAVASLDELDTDGLNRLWDEVKAQERAKA